LKAGTSHTEHYDEQYEKNKSWMEKISGDAIKKKLSGKDSNWSTSCGKY
jgi:hypothetical protein